MSTDDVNLLLAEAGGKYNPNTLWKLVDTRCQRISAAVSAARTPFLLAITWCLIWSWFQIVTEAGFLKLEEPQILDGMTNVVATMLYAKPHDSNWKNASDEHIANEALRFVRAPITAKQALPVVDTQLDKFVKDLRENPAPYYCYAFDSTSQPTCWLAYAMVKIGERKKSADETMFKQREVDFPGGFAKAYVSDLGILGSLALIVILTWGYFADRRENHSIRSFVDFELDIEPDVAHNHFDDEQKRALAIQNPAERILEVQNTWLSSEHAAYAYYSVAQSFVFLFSRKESRTALASHALQMIPPLVVWLNFGVDIYTGQSLNAKGELSARLIAEFILGAIVTFIWWKGFEFSLDTQKLLNAWFLAVRDVWLPDWDERRPDSIAPRARIFFRNQEARELVGQRASILDRSRKLYERRADKSI